MADPSGLINGFSVDQRLLEYQQIQSAESGEPAVEGVQAQPGAFGQGGPVGSRPEILPAYWRRFTTLFSEKAKLFPNGDFPLFRLPAPSITPLCGPQRPRETKTTVVERTIL